jgi:hypothetical protein
MTRPSAILVVALGSLLVSCAGPFHLGADGLRIDILASDIQKKIDQKGGFPIHKELEPVGGVQLSQATLVLVPAENSIGLSVPVEVKRLGRSWSGIIAFTAAPAYERETGIVYLHDFAVRDIQVPGLPHDMDGITSRVVTDILRDTIHRYDIYQLNGSHSKAEWFAKLVLKDIQVRADRVSVHLGL